jgi:FAD/FMN-containing dehydrogenase
VRLGEPAKVATADPNHDHFYLAKNMAGTSWGRWPRYQHTIVPIYSRFEPLPGTSPLLPYGNGRSYGDVCLNAGGTLITTRSLDRMISFDPIAGVLECEAGVLLADIISLVAPRGWFLTVLPGTASVTVGGAIANDVHGKNHHRVGSFGNHVLGFELLRSNGEVLDCSIDQNSDWFRATIGGLGLTGLIRKARLRLRPIANPWIKGDSQRFASLDAFFQIDAESDGGYEYTVAWLDCTARGRRYGRGVFIRGNHALASDFKAEADIKVRPSQGWKLRVPLTPPISPVCGASVRVLNTVVYHRPSAQRREALWHYRQFLFPLDHVSDWNRLYGSRGFFQYQCALPAREARAALDQMLKLIVDAQQASFLSVLKKFGAIPSLGLLSFPRPGFTLALDFPNRGEHTLRLLESLDAITRQAGGAVYPAKDARMSASSFQQYFPAWEEFRRFVDPRFSSSFWRRVTEE